MEYDDAWLLRLLFAINLVMVGIATASGAAIMRVLAPGSLSAYVVAVIVGVYAGARTSPFVCAELLLWLRWFRRRP